MQEQYRIIDERVAADEERTKIYAIPGIIKPLAAEQPSGGADREDDEEDEIEEKEKSTENFAGCSRFSIREVEDEDGYDACACRRNKFNL